MGHACMLGCWVAVAHRRDCNLCSACLPDVCGAALPKQTKNPHNPARQPAVASGKRLNARALVARRLVASTHGAERPGGELLHGAVHALVRCCLARLALTLYCLAACAHRLLRIDAGLAGSLLNIIGGNIARVGGFVYDGLVLLTLGNALALFVVVGVVVVVLRLFLRKCDNRAQDACVCGLQLLHAGQDSIALFAAFANGVYRAVYQVGDDGSIDEHAHGRGIEDNVVEHPTQLIYQCGEALGGKHVGRAGDVGLGIHEEQARLFGGG